MIFFKASMEHKVFNNYIFINKRQEIEIKKIINISISLIFLIALILPNLSRACSSFCILDSNNVLLGYNFDWYPVKGYIIINDRNISKIAIMPWKDEPVKWNSKFGNITFNSLGKDMPFCGMNEKGLTISQMWLNDTQYPEIDYRSAISELQWIQYQLDNSATVQDVIKSNDAIRISKFTIAPLHFFVCDRFGNVATIEFLKGKLVSHTGDELPIPILTNRKYDKSVKQLIEFMDFGGKDAELNTKWRFIKIASMLKKYTRINEKQKVKYSFDILDFVKQEHTRWSIVFDITNQQIFYKTFRNHKICSMNIHDFSFECNIKTFVINIDEFFHKSTYPFGELTIPVNREMILYNTKLANELSNVPNKIWEVIAKYPKTLMCDN